MAGKKKVESKTPARKAKPKQTDAATEMAPSAAAAATPTGSPRSDKKRVFVVDDHPILRQGLVQLLNREPDLEVVGEGDDVYDSLRAIRAARPDLCLVDVSLKGGDGIELVKELKAGDPDIAVLVLSMHDEQLYAERALRAGARGYIMKQEAPKALLDAVRRVLGGEIFVSPKMGASLLNRMVGSKTATSVSPMERLTDRELEIFRMIGAGLSVRQIAEKLFLSTKT